MLKDGIRARGEGGKLTCADRSEDSLLRDQVSDCESSVEGEGGGEGGVVVGLDGKGGGKGDIVVGLDGMLMALD